jgi:hypothetical protein
LEVLLKKPSSRWDEYRLKVNRVSFFYLDIYKKDWASHLRNMDWKTLGMEALLLWSIKATCILVS